MIDQPPAVTLPIPAEVPALTLDQFQDINRRLTVQELHLSGVQGSHMLLYGITVEEFSRLKLCAEWAVKHAQRPE